jgi:EAL domain-containing protein (putative c-di-GMP-specific phosphodiesterase class I)
MRTAESKTPRLRLPHFSIAFQPIVDIRTGSVYAYEALVRGRKGESYPSLTDHLGARERRLFDRVATSKALRIAARQRERWAGALISLNLRPDHRRAFDDAEHVLRRARRYGIEPSKILLELTEDVKLGTGHLPAFLEAHGRCGFSTAIDDFGAGYAGLSCLADCAPSMLKLDRAMTRGIDSNPSKQKIVGGFVAMCAVLGVAVVLEGVETMGEYQALESVGVHLMQGYLIGRPVFESFSGVAFPNKPTHPRPWEPVPLPHRSPGLSEADYERLAETVSLAIS